MALGGLSWAACVVGGPHAQPNQCRAHPQQLQLLLTSQIPNLQLLALDHQFGTLSLEFRRLHIIRQ